MAVGNTVKRVVIIAAAMVVLAEARRSRAMVGTHRGHRGRAAVDLFSNSGSPTRAIYYGTLSSLLHDDQPTLMLLSCDVSG